MWLYVPYLSALESEALISGWQDGREPYCMLSGTASPRPFSWRGWKARSWIALLSGLTLQRSTLDRGVAQWISSQQASHARRSRLLASNSEQPTSASFGRSYDESLFTLERRSYSWKMSRALFDIQMGSGHGFPILPASGSMRSGRLYARPMLERRTSESGSSCWPTADTNSSTYSNGARGMNLREAAMAWATAQAHDASGGKTPAQVTAMRARSRAGVCNLNEQAMEWNTINGLKGATPQSATGAALSPYFVEALMGLRDGWTVP